MERFRHILVPTDFGDVAGAALDLALELAAKFGSKVTVMHATWYPPATYAEYLQDIAWPTEELAGRIMNELSTVVAKAKQRHPDVDSLIMTGETWERVLEAAKSVGADLIVMGTHGRTGLSRALLGSVAEKVVRLSPVPVLTVSAEPERRTSEHTVAGISAGRDRDANAPRRG